jgi:hypothetical protein
MTYRALDPRPRGACAHVDLESGRQAVQEQSCSTAFATEVAANDAGHRSAASPPLVSQFALRKARRETRRGKQLGALPVPHLVGITVREDDDIARRKRQVVVATRTRARHAIRHQVEEHEMLAFRR